MALLRKAQNHAYSPGVAAPVTLRTSSSRVRVYLILVSSRSKKM